MTVEEDTGETNYGSAGLNIASITTALPFAQGIPAMETWLQGTLARLLSGSDPELRKRMLLINDNAPGSPQMVNLTGTSSCK